jgi:hypothetical protein
VDDSVSIACMKQNRIITSRIVVAVLSYIFFHPTQ